MRNFLFFLSLTFLSINIYSQQDRLPEYQGGEKAFKETLVKGLILPDSIDAEMFKFLLKVHPLDGKAELVDSSTSFSDNEILTSQFRELIQKMPKWNIKDTTIDHIEIDGYIAFLPSGINFNFRRTNVSNLTTIEQIMVHHADNRGDDEKVNIAIDFADEDMPDIKEEEPKEKPINPDVVTTIDHYPTFKGGPIAMNEYFSKNLKYPPQAKKYGISGKVTIKAIVEKDGTISNIKVVRALDPECDKEAVRLIKNMPKWTPGETSEGEIKRVSIFIPVRFSLPNNK